MNNTTLQFASSKIIMETSARIWGNCKLKDLGEWASGSGFPREYQGLDGSKYLFCKVSDMNTIGNEVYIHSTENTIDDEVARKINAKIHPKGTVIFPKIGGAIATNKRRILVKDTAIDNNCSGIIPKENVKSKWLYQLLNSIDFSTYQRSGPVPSLSQKTLEEIDVPCVRMEVQEQISLFLDWLNQKSPEASWDNSPNLPSELTQQKHLIRKIEQLIVRIEQIKKLRADAVEEVDELLKSELSRIFQKEDLETSSLGKVCKTSSGGTPSRSRSDFYKGEIPWLKSGELNDRLITNSEEHITKEALQNSNAKIFPKGTLLIALYGASVGKTGILGIDSSTNQAICAVFPRSDVLNTSYLHWFLKYKRNGFIDQSFGGAQPNISQRLLKKTKIPIPNLPIQRDIVGYLDCLQEKIDELKKLQGKTEKQIEELIPSLLDRAFKGEL